MKKNIGVLIGVVFVLSLTTVACVGITPPQTEEPESVEIVVTIQPTATEDENVEPETISRRSNLKMAADFSLSDSKGNMVSLADELQENEQVVLVFYISGGCPPCMAQLSEIENDRARYEEKGTQVLAIAVQDELGASTSAEVSNAQFPILAGDKAVAEAYGVFVSTSSDFDLGFGQSTPSVFIIDKDNQIVWSEITHIDGMGCGSTKRVPSQIILENLG